MAAETTGNWVITLKPNVQSDVVVEALKTNGLVVNQVLTEVGIVTGTCDNPDALKTVAGVLAVEPEYICHTLGI